MFRTKQKEFRIAIGLFTGHGPLRTRLKEINLIDYGTKRTQNSDWTQTNEKTSQEVESC